jgi:hypothetical protein
MTSSCNDGPPYPRAGRETGSNTGWPHLVAAELGGWLTHSADSVRYKPFATTNLLRRRIASIEFFAFESVRIAPCGLSI